MWNPFKKRPSQPPQPQKPETPDYPTLFEELTEIVKGGATGDEVEVWMKRRGVDESGLVRWLAGYVGEVKRSRSDEGKVLEALQGLSEVARGDLGRMAREFATYLQGSETEVDSEASEEEEAGERSNLSEVQKFNELLSQMGTSQPVSTNFQELDRRGLEMRSLSYQEWFNLGNALLYLGRLKEALDSFDKALQIQPDDHEAWNNRGFALSNLGRLEEAIASYDKALQIQPDFHLAWFNRGIALGNLGKLEEAIASYDQALQIQPDNHQVWVNRGNTLKNLGRLEEAIVSYDKALQIQPDNHPAWYNRGIVLKNLGRLEEAIDSYDKALQIQPDDHDVWFNRGLALENLGRLEEVISSFDQALQIQPDDHEAWNDRGTALLYLGRLEEALASYDQALQIQPDLHQAWVNRGNVLADLDRLEEGIASFDQALQIQPDFHEAWHNRGIVAASSTQHDPKFQRHFLFDFQGSLNQSHQRIFSEETSLQQSIQRFLSPEVAREIQQTAQKHFSLAHPELNQRGYEGKLNSLQFPLNQNIICQDTHPEGWGDIHHQIGKAHYNRGRFRANPYPYWRKAANSYKTALKTLTASNYPELHLEVLQDLSKVLLALKEPEEARVILQDGTDLFNRMLKEFKGGDYAKQQLARKFTAFNQLTVSLALQSGHPRNALTLAETGKNTCLRWIWNYGEIPELTYPQIRELLATPATALIYWHLSPISLSTFLLLPNDPDPILISPPPPTQPEDEREPALLQVLAFEEWVKKWNEDYDNYETKKDEENPSKIDVTWYEELETQLAQLKTLLNIAAIEQHLKTHAINHLILIPHRDLHRFPLPTFFPDRPCTILPSAYLGMSENNPPDPDIAADILIVENPPSKPKIGNQPKPLPGLPFAEVESALIQQQFRDSGSPLTKGGRGGFQCLPNNNATKTRVTEALQQSHHIFHFCGHGAYHSQNPALSSLYLNGEDTLTLKDILNLDLREYRLVVLSACETAVTGNQTITDEYVGLVSGFLRAGATHVLSTLWTVQSFATTLLVVTFYQNLHSGQSPATALKNAQSWLKTATKTDLQTWLDDAIATLQQDFSFKRLLEIRRQNIDTMESDRPYAHPYYWSAFTLSGR